MRPRSMGSLNFSKMPSYSLRTFAAQRSQGANHRHFNRCFFTFFRITIRHFPKTSAAQRSQVLHHRHFNQCFLDLAKNPSTIRDMCWKTEVLKPKRLKAATCEEAMRKKERNGGWHPCARILSASRKHQGQKQTSIPTLERGNRIEGSVYLPAQRNK
jgi:hypothetical protein